MSNIQAAARGGGRTTAAARRWRFRPGLRKAMLTVHVVASVALVGTTASVMVLALRAAAADASEAHALYETGLALAFALAIPFSMVSLASGIALGVGTPWGVFRYYWVVTKLALQVAIILLGATLVGPSLGDLIDATGAGHDHVDLGSGRWVVTLAGAANLLFAAAATGLAVYKPWGRIRQTREATPNTGRATGQLTGGAFDER